MLQHLGVTRRSVKIRLIFGARQMHWIGQLPGRPSQTKAKVGWDESDDLFHKPGRGLGGIFGCRAPEPWVEYPTALALARALDPKEAAGLNSPLPRRRRASAHDHNLVSPRQCPDCIAALRVNGARPCPFSSIAGSMKRSNCRN